MAADLLAEHLELSRFVVMKRPPIPALALDFDDRKKHLTG